MAGIATGIGLGCIADCCAGPDDELDEPAPVYVIERQGPVELYSWVEDSARVHTDGDALVITYTTIDGASWEVEYRRTGTVGE